MLKPLLDKRVLPEASTAHTATVFLSAKLLTYSLAAVSKLDEFESA